MNPNEQSLIPLPDNSPLCPVAGLILSETCTFYIVQSTISLFRQIINSEELSVQALEIVNQVLDLSQSFYPAWQYRKLLFHHLNLNLQDELEFLRKIAIQNPKNYQMWHYRKDLLKICTNSQQEFEFVDGILALDERNVHAWGYRLWVVERFDLWQQDLEFIQGYIENCPRNNSAWNYRNSIWPKCGKNVEENLGFVFRFVNDLLNEPCFEYLRSLCDRDNCDEIRKKIGSVAVEEGICVGVVKVLRKCAHIRNQGSMARWCCRKLSEIDEIRKEYWIDCMNQEDEGEILDEEDKRICEYFSN